MKREFKLKETIMNIGAKRGAALVRLIENFCDKQAWSIREFARRAGVRHSTISAWKNSDVIPDTRSLSKIADVMGLDIADLWVELKSSNESYVSFSQILDALRNLEVDQLGEIGNQVNTLLVSKCSA